MIRNVAVLSLLLATAPLQAQDDSWRNDALARIEKIRKAPFTVRVVTPEGRPVAGAAVNIEMKRHAFAFGTAVAAAQLLAKTEDAARYQHHIRELFNSLVFENDLKWPQWEANRQRALDGLAWAREQGFTRIRGHNLVWPSWRWLPKDLPSLESNPEAMRRRVLDHIADEATAVRGQVQEWDVVNEPYTNKDLLRILGDEEMAAWFRAARAADPRALLYINDFNIFENGAKDAAHTDHFYETIRKLRSWDAPVGGIGIQGHFKTPTDPATLIAILDRFASFQLPITITEFDFNTEDEALQAAFTRDFLTVCFSHPSVDGVLYWGFWEGRHWLPKSAMLRKDWTPKPNYDVYRELVLQKWWTRDQGVTDKSGERAIRAFQGEYQIEAKWSGRVVSQGVQLGKDGTTVTLKMPARR